jgi:plasmid stabilization system protein ParE
MEPYAAEFSPQARAQLEAIQAWWHQHRQSSADLLVQELTAVLRHLQRSPYLGKIYEPRGAQPVRRILLNRTRYHLYYRPDDTARKIYIDAIWYAGRGQAPPIP